MHRSASTGRKQSSTSTSSTSEVRRPAGAGAVKISLASLKWVLGLYQHHHFYFVLSSGLKRKLLMDIQDVIDDWYNIIRKVFLYMCLIDERPSKQERDSPLQSRIIRWWWWWWWLSECLIRSNNVRQRNVGNTIEGRSLGNPISGCSESIIGSMHIWGSICYMSKSVGVKVVKIL